LGDASSLKGGNLILTPLRGANRAGLGNLNSLISGFSA
jgi:flagellar basal body P-ring protein FlgI